MIRARDINRSCHMMKVCSQTKDSFAVHGPLVRVALCDRTIVCSVRKSLASLVTRTIDVPRANHWFTIFFVRRISAEYSFYAHALKFVKCWHQWFLMQTTQRCLRTVDYWPDA